MGGMDTPESLDLRKGRPGESTGDSTPSEVEPKQLYKVLDTVDAPTARGQFMGSTHVYNTAGISGGSKEPSKIEAAKDKLGLAKKGNQAVDIALDPSELEDLDEEQLKAKYAAQRAANKEAAKGEDYSDIIEENEKKRKAQGD